MAKTKAKTKFLSVLAALALMWGMIFLLQPVKEEVAFLDEQVILSSTGRACPVTDGGVGDGDSTVNGTIQINGNTTWDTTDYTVDGDWWDCTGKTVHVTNNATLSFQGDKVNGYIPFLKTDDLTIDSGASISADGGGCSTTTQAAGSGPNGSNVCTDNTAGYGTGENATNVSKGTGGGGYGGAGGQGDGGAGVNLGGVSYGDMNTATFGSSGGNARTNAYGGAGGGAIRINITNTFTHNGLVTANGEDGNTENSGKDNATGGGSGGHIAVLTGTITGTTGSFSAAGGNGGDLTNADGGGGGRRSYSN